MNAKDIAALTAIPLELERMSSELQAGLAQYANGTRLDAARVVTVRPGMKLVWGSKCRLVGWSLSNTAGGLVLRDGRDGGGDVVAVAIGTHWLGATGVQVTDALSVDTVPDGVVGAIYLGAVD